MTSPRAAPASGGAGAPGPAGRPRVLLVRNDRLGDFLLAWPALALLKSSLPEARVYALVPAYTAPLARLCPWIDEVVEDPGPAAGGGLGAARELAGRLRPLGVDAAILLYLTGRTALAARLAGIPERIGPATRIPQVLLTRRIVQRRSRSLKPESEYNADLVRAFLAARGIAPRAGAGPPYLALPKADVASTRAAWCAREGLDPNRPLVMVHPGSGGSAPGLTPAQLGRFAARLRSPAGHALVITAGPDELDRAEAVRAAVDAAGPASRSGEAASVQVRIFHSTAGLDAFARHVAGADLFLANSTGPLHLAGALDVPTVGFYPRTPVMGPLRWRTLNSPGRLLAVTPPDAAGPEEMGAIDLEAAAERVSRTFLGAPNREATAGF